jgi:two-component system LytT family sensor kinase
MTNKEIVLSYLKNKRFVRTSLLFWLILYLLFMVLQFFGSREGDYMGYIQVSLGIPVIMLIFYINFFLCALFLVRKKSRYFLYNILFLALFLFFIYQYSAADINLVRQQLGTSWLISAIRYLFALTLYYIVLILISTLYWSITYASTKTKENLQIQLKLQNMENEKVIAEKQFLQSQINPHFLYNTLNFFYAKSLSLSPELAESVLLLSNIMRYSLEQKENSSGMVFLEDEIEHINNVIKINQFRFNNKLQIQFLISGSISKVRIVPLVLITLVENAFKHGELLDPAVPVMITLTINENKQAIEFMVKNKKKTGPKEMGTGIGLENTKKRLEFAYNHNHKMELKNEDEFYTAILQLPLFKDV